MNLLNSAEELNFRLWNFSTNIVKRWHNKTKSEWKLRRNYYFHSFIYRFLVFLNLVFETEKSVLTYDSTVFSHKDNDIDYLKYIKTFKNYFCDILMLREFGYSGENATNHFFKDYLAEYVKYVSNEKGDIISFDEYFDKIEQNLDGISLIMNYIAKIEKDSNNINYNVMM